MQNVKPRLRSVLMLGAIAALAAVSFLSLSTTPSLPVGPQFNDKINHFLAYGVLAFLFAGAQKRPVAYLTTAVLLMLYGVGIEVSQALMGNGRQASAVDALANCLGVGSGLLASRFVRLLVFPRRSGDGITRTR